MRETTSEIKKVFDKHQYSIDSIVFDVMQTFKLKSIIQHTRFEKQEGYAVTEILALLIMFPLMLVSSVNGFFHSEFQAITTMKKDALYRLKNNESVPWRTILYGIAKRFQKIVNPDKIVAANSAFILDDTTDRRVGRHLENVSYVFDHVIGKTLLGFKHLVLGFFDGTTFIPLDFTTHAEKRLRGRKRREQYRKTSRPGSPGAIRRKECAGDKMTQAIAMVKRAVKHGFQAHYVLADSWFGSKRFIQAIRQIKNGALHVVCGVRKDKRRYLYQGNKVNAQALLAILKKAGNAKRCRKLNTRYYEVVVYYEDIGDVKLYVCRFPYQKQWRVFLSTDTTLSFVAMMEIYATRWTIEVFFKEMKQQLRLGQCKSRDFDAQLAHVTTCCILYIFLAYFRRVHAYAPLGALFESMSAELVEKNLAERLWALFEDLLEAVVRSIAESGAVDLRQFKRSPEYATLKALFEESFLGHQLQALDKTA